MLGLALVAVRADDQENIVRLSDKVTGDCKNESKRIDELEIKFTKMFQNMDGLLKNETARTMSLEQKVKQQDATIKAVKASESALKRQVQQVFELLPNSSFVNGSSVFQLKLEELTKRIAKEHEDTVYLGWHVNDVDKNLKTTNQLVEALEKSLNDTVKEDHRLENEVNSIKQQRIEDLDKYNPDQYGFRYTGRGWSYYTTDQITKKGYHLKDCLKFCSVKRAMNKEWNGVNFFDYPGDGPKRASTICYCVKGAYGSNPNEHALRFVA